MLGLKRSMRYLHHGAKYTDSIRANDVHAAESVAASQRARGASRHRATDVPSQGHGQRTVLRVPGLPAP